MISSLYLHSKSQNRPLRIGVLVDGFRLSASFRQVLVDIAHSDFANLELVVVNAAANAPSKVHSGELSRYASLLRDPMRRSAVLYSMFQRLNVRQRLAGPDPLEIVDCADILGNCSRLEVLPITKRFVHRFPPDAITAIQTYKIDVMLRFGFNILRGEVLTSARFGVWSFHHGDNDHYRGGPAHFWEVVEDNPVSGVVLQVLNEKLDDGMVICKSIFSSERGLWPNRNRFRPYWGSTHFVIRKLHQLHERGWDSVRKDAVAPAPYRGKSEIYRSPTNTQMLRWLAPALGRKVAGRLNPMRREQMYHWRICLRKSNPFVPSTAGSASRFKWLESPRGHFYADPFLCDRGGQMWLFFEDYHYGDKRGRISCAPIGADLSVGPARTCLDLPYHLSFPNVFQHGGESFMIPESSANQSVELWRATDFPYSWKFEKKLFSGSLVDTVPVLHHGRWYFFTSLCATPGNAAFGALFSADDLTGKWEHHPASPICTDVRSARSAGAIIKSGDRIFRPVQDCGESYGRRMHVEEILELTPDSYRSHRCYSIEPDWERGLAGTHTYGLCAGIEVRDAVRFVSRSEVD